MEHTNQRDFDDADALEPAPSNEPGDHNKSVQQHDWGRGESLELGNDTEDEPHQPSSDEPAHDSN